MLQWGRGLGTAERNRRSDTRPPRTRASMGPRSWDRGECEACYSRRVGPDALQWGRGLGTAESAPLVAEHGLIDSGLQWGRGLGTAESGRLRTRSRAFASFNGAAVLGPRRERSPP